VKKQLDFADSDVETLDVSDLAIPHTPPDDNDLFVDNINTIYDWPETHSSPTHILPANLGSLLSAQAALDAAALAGKFQLIPPSYTAEGSDNIDGLPVHDDPHGSTVSLDLTAASDTTAGTVEPSTATGTTGTGDTDLGLAAAASGTETTYGDEDTGVDADAPPQVPHLYRPLPPQQPSRSSQRAPQRQVSQYTLNRLRRLLRQRRQRRLALVTQVSQVRRRQTSRRPRRPQPRAALLVSNSVRFQRRRRSLPTPLAST